MEMGLITESNTVNPVVVFFHLVIKLIVYFYSGLFILCREFLFHLNVIWKKFQIQFQYTNCGQVHLAQTHLSRVSQTIFFQTLNSKETNSFDVLLSSVSSGSARSPFFNIMNSSFSLNRAYCLSVRSFTNCKMSLILLLGLDNRYLLKVKSHQFSILHNIKHNLHWISLTLHQKKLFPNTYYAWKKKQNSDQPLKIWSRIILWHFLGHILTFLKDNHGQNS